MVSPGDSGAAQAVEPEAKVSKWGEKHLCTCGCKYYDLNRPKPACPKCGSAPGKGTPKAAAKLVAARVEPEPEEDELDGSGDDGDGDLGDFDDDDLSTLGDGEDDDDDDEF